MRPAPAPAPPRFTWHQYANEAARRNRLDNVRLAGVIWANGPRPSTRWVLPDGLPQRQASLIVVTESRDGSWYAVGPVPEGATRA